MPELLIHSLNRRDFLRTSLTSLGMMAAWGKARASESGPEGSIRWALLSDTHVPEKVDNEYRGFKPYENMKTTVSQVSATTPEGVLIDGDLARLEGLPGDYTHLKMFLDSFPKSIPICMAMGNHDKLENFRSTFPSQPGRPQEVKSKQVLVLDLPPVRFILLDSLLVTNQVPGFLGQEQRDWLEDFLHSADATPTLLFFHHYPDYSDTGLLDADRLIKIVAPLRQVKALIFGHSHRYFFMEQDGLHYINLPSTAYNFRDDDPVGWIDTRITAKGGEFTLHAIGGNTADNGKTTSLEWRG